jgi:hypothetical protein
MPLLLVAEIGGLSWIFTVKDTYSTGAPMMLSAAFCSSTKNIFRASSSFRVT